MAKVIFAEKKMAVGLLALLLVAGGWDLYSLTDNTTSAGVVKASGFVEGTRDVLSAQIFDTVAELAVDEGQTVKKGQVEV